MGYRNARYPGLTRNVFYFTCLAVACNFNQSFSLIEPAPPET